MAEFFWTESKYQMKKPGKEGEYLFLGSAHK
jgi:hypothetical protein